MQPTSIDVNVGIYTFHWQDAHRTTIRIERMRESRDSLSGEMTITCDGQHINQAKISLMYPKSRTEIVNHVCERARAVPKQQWKDMIDFACIYTVRKHREGEPIVEVGNLPTGNRPKHLLYPLLVENQANLLYGAGGSGKSYLSAFICLVLEVGERTCGLVPAYRAKTLYLDYETSQEEINDRLQRLKKGMSLPGGVQILYRFCHQSVIAEIAEIQRMVVDHNVGFVVVDSYGMACGGEPESADIARTNEWTEKRPGKVASNETVQLSNAVAKTVFAAAGVIRLRWQALGNEACPLCQEMNGRVVGIDAPFLPADGVLQSETGNEIKAYRPTMQPPLHQGCVCQIVPG